METGIPNSPDFDVMEYMRLPLTQRINASSACLTKLCRPDFVMLANVVDLAPEQRDPLTLHTILVEIVESMAGNSTFAHRQWQHAPTAMSEP